MNYGLEVSDCSLVMPTNDELVLLERVFGTTFARALNWCVEIPGYTPMTDDDQFSHVDEMVEILDDDDEHRNE